MSPKRKKIASGMLELCEKINEVARQYFRNFDTKAIIQIKLGFGNNIHIHITTELFEKMSWREREEMVWSLLEKSLTKKEIEKISLLMLLSLNEAGARYDELKTRNEQLRARVLENMAKYQTQSSHSVTSEKKRKE